MTRKRQSPETLADNQRIGKDRHKSNRKRGVVDGLQSQTLSAYGCDIIGVMGEWAAATYCGCAYNQDTSKKDDGWDFVLPDGRKVDVKTAQQVGYRLAISKEPVADIYVLAYAHPEKVTVYLAGWCTREEFEAGHHIAREMRNRPRAMYPEQLHPMKELNGAIEAKEKVRQLQRGRSLGQNVPEGRAA